MVYHKNDFMVTLISLPTSYCQVMETMPYPVPGTKPYGFGTWQLARRPRRFEDHTKDVLSVAFSVDNRQIVSGSRDRTIKLWNTLAECKYTIQDDGHSDWVSCVRFSPNHANPIIVSAGWDRMVKVWNLTNCRLKINHSGHTGYLNTVHRFLPMEVYVPVVVKTAKLCYHNDIITALCFSPNRYWLCAAFGPSIKIWDLESKEMVDELRPEVVSQTSKAEPPQCLSLAWSTDGQTLFAGYSDNTIRVWQVSVSAH
ncbi:hypothetical protein NQ317_012448 [Molorchus minor]|uniref:Small ribosomal subunit protein RACK1 n=1 Tax=Molorchus minor TaxID=1323400 RepID=A0ABQ9J3C4_9CUCU|nr:hypothetical protein NQ317_012448 [Molorchus minor]